MAGQADASTEIVEQSRGQGRSSRTTFIAGPMELAGSIVAGQAAAASR
jgi:hypothetical protein